MKVLLAGMSKTGTKSMAVALRELGYDVYDYLENYMYLGKDWEKIFRDGGSTDDFRRMYENVDAVVDVPAFAYWDEILKAFPDTKVNYKYRFQMWFTREKVFGEWLCDACCDDPGISRNITPSSS